MASSHISPTVRRNGSDNGNPSETVDFRGSGPTTRVGVSDRRRWTRAAKLRRMRHPRRFRAAHHRGGRCVCVEGGWGRAVSRLSGITTGRGTGASTRKRSCGWHLPQRSANMGRGSLGSHPNDTQPVPPGWRSPSREKARRTLSEAKAMRSICFVGIAALVLVGTTVGILANVGDPARWRPNFQRSFQSPPRGRSRRGSRLSPNGTPKPISTGWQRSSSS